MSRPGGRTATTEPIILKTKYFICLIISLIVSACGGNPAEGFFEATQRTLLRDTPFEVPANEWVVIGRIFFDDSGAARNQRFTGSVTSESPLELLILNQQEFTDFEADRPSGSTFSSGLSANITFDLPVEPEGYQFVIDNRSLTTPVNITATIVLEQEEIIDPNILDVPL